MVAAEVVAFGVCAATAVMQWDISLKSAAVAVAGIIMVTTWAAAEEEL
jgi:hypothetical protein